MGFWCRGKAYEKLTYTVLTEYSFKEMYTVWIMWKILDNLIGYKNSEELRPKFIISM